MTYKPTAKMIATLSRLASGPILDHGLWKMLAWVVGKHATDC
jgi:hypothetical protein